MPASIVKNPGMNTTSTPQTITITITGQLTLSFKNLEPVLRTLQIQVPPSTQPPANPEPSQPGGPNFIAEMQLLEKLSISRRTLFQWRRSGKIPSAKLGRRVLYHWPSVEATLLRCQRGGEW